MTNIIYLKHSIKPPSNYLLDQRSDKVLSQNSLHQMNLPTQYFFPVHIPLSFPPPPFPLFLYRIYSVLTWKVQTVGLRCVATREVGRGEAEGVKSHEYKNLNLVRGASECRHCVNKLKTREREVPQVNPDTQGRC